MKILMLVSSDLDRDPRVQKEARSALAEGHDVTVICRAASLSYPFSVLPTYVTKPRSRRALRLLWERLRFSVRCIVRAPRVLDVVHANDLDMLPVGWLIATRTRAALIYDSHESWTDLERGLPRPLVSLFRSLEGFLCRRSDSVVTVSEPIARHLAESYRVPMPTVVSNAPEYQDMSAARGRAIRLDSAGPRLVLFHGLFRDMAGLEQLIRAAAHFPDDVHLGLRGYGPLEGALRDLVHELDVSDRVRFLPPVPVDELIPAAANADIGVIPLPPETRQNLGSSPNKLYQYLMAGLPVATSRIPTIEPIVSTYEVGRVFDVYRPQSMAEVVMSLLEPSTLERLSRNALIAAKTLNWEHEYPKLSNVYAAVDRAASGR